MPLRRRAKLRSEGTKATKRRGKNRQDSTTAESDRHKDDLLPTCEGPKLYPFKDQNPIIEFKALLHDRAVESSEMSDGSSLGGSVGGNLGGGQGYVFKASINSETFALKLFKFFDLRQERLGFSDEENDEITDEELTGNVDPFFAECRAYGCIENFYREQGPRRKDGDVIAVPCYGYLYISAAQEEDLRERFGIEDWNRSDDNEEDLRRPIRALVKKLISTKEPVNKKERSVRRMCSDLKKLHSIGVHPRDIFARNFRGGLIVDFGRALTEPSCVLRVLPKWQADAEIQGDFENFDDMIQQLGIKSKVRAAPHANYQTLTREEKKRRKLGPNFIELDASGKQARPTR